MKNKFKNIEIVLKPEDFKNCDYGSTCNCALARAVNRHFKVNTSLIDHITVDFENSTSNHKSFNILNEFTQEDFEFVKAEYEKDPKMVKAQYVVTLIPTN